MAVAALRVAAGHLPPACSSALRAALRPPGSREGGPLKPAANAAATAALRMAVVWLPDDLPKAAALAVARGGRADAAKPAPAPQRPKPEHKQAGEVGRGAVVALAVVVGRLHPAARAVLVPTAASMAPQPGRRPRARAAGSVPHFGGPPSLCGDTSSRVVEQLWPAALGGGAPGGVSEASDGASPPASRPRGTWLWSCAFEDRLRKFAPLLRDLQQASAVAPGWALFVDRMGWPSAHAYLFQQPGTKGELRQRFADSTRQLTARDWVRRHLGNCAAGATGAELFLSSSGLLVRRISDFMPA